MGTHTPSFESGLSRSSAAAGGSCPGALALQARRVERPWDDGRCMHDPHSLRLPAPPPSPRARVGVPAPVQEETRAALRGLREEKKAWLEARRRRRRDEGRRSLESGRAPPAAAPQAEEEDRGKALSAVDGILGRGASPDSATPTGLRRATRAESSRKRGGCRGVRSDEETAEGIGRKVEVVSIHPGGRAESAVAPAAALEVLRQEEEGEL